MNAPITLGTRYTRDGETVTLKQCVDFLRAHGLVGDIDPRDAHELPALLDGFRDATTTTGLPTVHEVLAAYYFAAMTELNARYLAGAVTRDRFDAAVRYISHTVFDMTEDH